MSDQVKYKNQKGLTDTEVIASRQKYGENVLSRKKKKSFMTKLVEAQEGALAAQGAASEKEIRELIKDMMQATL